MNNDMSAHKEAETPEKAYDVHLYPIVRMKIRNVIAVSQMQAISKAYEIVGAIGTFFDREFGKGETVDHIEYADEEAYYLVDEVGDSEFINTRFYKSTGTGYELLDKPVKPAFSYHTDGEHSEHSLEDWRQEVCDGNTVLGYEEWVQHRIES